MLLHIPLFNAVFLYEIFPDFIYRKMYVCTSKLVTFVGK